MIPTDHLQRLVARWLPTQRWFAGKGRGADRSVSSCVARPVRRRRAVARARRPTATDGTELYQLPLVAHPEPVDYLDHVLLGTVDTGDGTAVVYDALHDKDVTGVWLESIRDRARRRRRCGSTATPTPTRCRSTRPAWC